jgi:hypothetical protein
LVTAFACRERLDAILSVDTGLLSLQKCRSRSLETKVGERQQSTLRAGDDVP